MAISKGRGVLSVLMLLTVTGLVAANPAIGGIFDMLFTKKIRYQIRVLDENNQPIPAATIWAIHSDPSEPDVKPDLMQRLIANYANVSNFDYVHKYELHSALEVHFVGKNGVFEIEYGETEIGSKDRFRASIAAIKRGYKPTVIWEDAPIGSQRTVTLHLIKNPDEPVDSRMLEFDLLKAQAQSSESLGALSEEKAKLLTRIHQAMRGLALDFERDGKLDQAAILYHQLAFLPSVDLIKNAAGKIVVSGYTNSYDERFPQRVADLKKAMKLNQSNPQIKFDKMFHEFESKGIMDFYKKETRAVRAEFIQAIELYLSTYPGRMWPKVYQYLVKAYDGQGEVNKACQALRRFYLFEPAYYNKAGWESEIGQLKAGLELEKWSELKKSNPSIKLSEISVDFDCQIPGLQ